LSVASRLFEEAVRDGVSVRRSFIEKQNMGMNPDVFSANDYYFYVGVGRMSEETEFCLILFQKCCRRKSLAGIAISAVITGCFFEEGRRFAVEGAAPG